MEDDFISIIIPAYNEERRLGPTLDRIRQYMSGRPYEIIVVDDGSTDATASLAGGKPEVMLLSNERNMGKGFSIRKGVLSSKGSLVLLCDADMSTPIEEFDKLLGFINGGYDIAIGSRGLEESDLALRQPWYRERMGKTFNLIVRMLIVGEFRDTQCGFKLFMGGAARRIFKECRIGGFGFDVEAIFLAGKMGYRIKEVPVRWLNSPESKVRVLRDSTRMLLDILRIRAYWLKGVYGINPS